MVGLEPTYREGQYELFVNAGRFYGPLPLHWRISILQIIENCIGGREFSTSLGLSQPAVWNMLRYLPFPDLELPGFFQNAISKDSNLTCEDSRRAIQLHHNILTSANVTFVRLLSGIFPCHI